MASEIESAPVTLSTTVFEDEADLASIRDQWDALAVANGRPFSAPGWMLAWWRHTRPKGTRMRVVAVHEEDRLLGVCPLFARHRHGLRPSFEVMTAQLSPPAGLLAERGREAEVAQQMVNALTATRPKPASIRFWQGYGSDGEAPRFTETSSDRDLWLYTAQATPLPLVSLDGCSYEEWVAGLSSKFRQETRRLRRRLEQAGGRFVSVGPEGMPAALDAFIVLHGQRWDDRGGSEALVPGLKPMLLEAADELLPSGRLRVFTIEAEGRPIAVNILVAAGDQVNGWNSGFDESWGRYSPSTLLTLHAIADAAERGEARLNLGPGRAGYKSRIADREGWVAMTTLVQRDAAYPISRLRLMPYELRVALSRRLSQDSKQRLHRLARR